MDHILLNALQPGSGTYLKANLALVLGVGNTSKKISIPILECPIFWYRVLFMKNRKFR